MRVPDLWSCTRDSVHAAAAVLIALALLGPQAGAHAQSTEPYKPEIGQAGKDVIWVPTSEKAVQRMLEMAKVGPGDFLIDLGSGDGRIVIAAAQHHGARGFGVDLNPEMVKLSEFRAQQARVSDRAKFYVRDIFQTDLKQATVVTLYLLTELNLRLRPSLLKLTPGTRIVANTFDMGEWEADEFDTSMASSLRLWIVPAQVSGAWTWSVTVNGKPRQFELDMNQQFQRISGVVKLGQQRLRLRDAKLRGDQVSFVLLEEQHTDHGVRYDFSGRAKGSTIEGEVSVSDGNVRARWVATRRSPAAATRS
jgi:hypothetical protein